MSMKFVCFVLFVLLDASLSFASSLEHDWLKFKEAFNKKYPSDSEEKIRKSYFKENLKLIARHNRDYDLKLTTFTLGLNRFADMTNFEFQSTMKGFKMTNQSFGHVRSMTGDVSSLPRSVDWRGHGVVTPVKDQARCGSCWAFSATGTMESAHALNTGQLVSLSEQNLIDCTQGNMGCNGGWMDSAYNYVIANGGIDTESSYRYTAQGGICRFSAGNIGATISYYYDVNSGDEKALQDATATVGPISVAIDASSPEFQFYKSGIYDNPSCSTSNLDHAVLVVGYGDQSNGDYWIVKNSWGTSWGASGYIYMSRNKYNQCGIATRASYPIV